jgi:fibronectin type 3 domain-containing protein
VTDKYRLAVKTSPCLPLAKRVGPARRSRRAGELLNICLFEPLEGRTLMSAIPAPSVLTATAIAPTTVKLHWKDVSANVKGYEILRSTDGAEYAQLTALDSDNVSSYKDATTASGHAYEYVVEAFKGAKISPKSNVASTTTPPKAVSNLSASATGPNSIELNWKDNDTAATGYEILRSTNGVTFTQIGTVTSATATSYDDTTANSGHTYQYEVEVFDKTVAGAASGMAGATTPLAAPTNVVATAAGDSINLTWTDNDASASGYSVLRSTDGANYSSIATLKSGTADSFTDATTVSGTTYFYEVQATNAVAISAPSGAASATTPLAAVSDLTAVANGPTSVSLSWIDNDSSANGYYVLSSPDGVNFTRIAILTSTSATTYTDNAALSGHSDVYEVQAYDLRATSPVSQTATAITPLIAPSGLTAMISSGAINLTWADNDAFATGYYIFRSTGGGTFSKIATISGGTSDNYQDQTASSGAGYAYEVQAFNLIATSTVSTLASATMPLAPVSGLTATELSATSVQLNWTDNDSSATGYYILHSTNGVSFTKIATLNSSTAITYTDTAPASGHSNEYEVEAFDAMTTSAASTVATAITPLIAPSNLSASLSGYSVNLTWTDNDSSATGYYILRSADDVHFTTIATLNSLASISYKDSTAAAATAYTYEVQAFNALTTSPVSVSANVTTPASNVSLATRYGDELTVTATGLNDSIAIFESGTTFTIEADGSTYIDPATAGGLFVYTRGGVDSINVDGSVTSAVTLETIDGAATTITSAGSDVTAWIDSTDIYTGAGTVHRVASFAGGVSKAIGAALPNPTDAGTTAIDKASLFGTGPVAADVNQGEVGDCYFLASLAAFAGQDPQVLMQSAVDMGDGTYTVQFMSYSVPEYVRVSDAFSTGPFDGFMYAQPGPNGTIWAPVMEKAFAYFRDGANTYASINSGWMDEVYEDFGLSATDLYLNDYTSTSLYNLLSTDLSAGDPVTFGTGFGPPNLVGSHAYTLVSAYLDNNGVAHYVVRNPWGVSGDSLENSQGYATLTYSQLVANFTSGGCA